MKDIGKINYNFQNFCSQSPNWKILPSEIYQMPWLAINLSKNNSQISDLNLKNSMHPLGQYVDDLLKAAKLQTGYGGWQEERALYEMSPHFLNASGQSRSIHLGIDIWTKAETPILCPFPAKLHSFQDNDHFLDYGPTLILEHQVSQDFTFFSLYGHLSRNSLVNKKVGQKFEQGEQIATLGAPPENGDWPAHLHFQIILDMFNKFGDFPGVSSTNEVEYYKTICPDPGLILMKNLLFL